MTTKPENCETNSVAIVTEDSVCSSTNPESCEKPPDTFNDLPPELRPDKDGNPPVITERLLRSLRGKYFTVRHVRLGVCNHLLDMINQPKNNCEQCWFQFFNTHPQLVEVADQFFRTQGKKPMIGMRGEKFVKNFLRYMATVIHLMKQEGRIPNDAGNPEGSNAGSIDSQADAQGHNDQAGGSSHSATDGADVQRGQVESRGISSGIV